MRRRSFYLIPAALLLATAFAAAQGTLEKRKEGTYFLELGEVFLRSDESDFAIAFIDPDGDAGPEPSSPVTGPSNDVFSTDPRVVLGLNRPDGKTTIAFTVWEFNAEDGFLYQSDPATQRLTPTTTIPALILTRQGGINPLEDVEVAQERDLKYASGNWEHNLHETKKHRTRLIAGLKYVQFEERATVNNRYGTELWQQITTYLESQDRQMITAEANSNRLGPNVGIESRLKLGKRFRLTTRAELAVTEESIVVHYNNLAGEVFPRVGLTTEGIRLGQDMSAPPQGIHDRQLIRFLNLTIRDTSEHKIVPVGEFSLRGGWDLGRYVTMGLEYRWLALWDVPSAYKTMETVRNTISPIDVDVVGLEDHDPDNDQVIYNFTVDPIVQRHNVVFDGINVFMLFRF